MPSNLIEKKIRKELRLKKLISKNNRLLMIDKLPFYYIRKIIKMPVEIIPRERSFFGIKEMDEKVFQNKKLDNFVKKNKITKIILPWTMENELDYFLDCLFSNKKLAYLGHYDKFVKLFISVEAEHLIRFAKLKKIKFEANKKYAFLDEMNLRHKETKTSLLKTIYQVNQALSTKT